MITYLGSDILECEVKLALGSLTTNKASGGNGIPAELFQILKDDAMKVLHSICQQIWKTQQWPQDWKRSVFIPIPKQGNDKECSNYRSIALHWPASKVMLKILQARLQPHDSGPSGQDLIILTAGLNLCPFLWGPARPQSWGSPSISPLQLPATSFHCGPQIPAALPFCTPTGLPRHRGALLCLTGNMFPPLCLLWHATACSLWVKGLLSLAGLGLIP